MQFFLAKCRDLRTFFLVPPNQSKLFPVPPLSFFDPWSNPLHLTYPIKIGDGSVTDQGKIIRTDLGKAV